MLKVALNTIILTSQSWKSARYPLDNFDIIIYMIFVDLHEFQSMNKMSIYWIPWSGYVTHDLPHSSRAR